MKIMRRALATTVAGLALAAATIAVAAPASADPGNGQGCVGTAAVPASYICVIAVTPANAVPTVTTTNTIPVSVPSICYFVGCTAPTTVAVPVPGVAPGSGYVAVLWYQGQTYPIAAGTGAVPLPLIMSTVTLVEGTALGVVNGLKPTIDGLVETARQAAEDEVQWLIDRINGLPSADELVASAESKVQGLLDTLYPTIQDEYYYVVGRYVVACRKVANTVYPYYPDVSFDCSSP
jgi:hypothetical protein